VKPRLPHPGLLFVTALVFMVLAIPFAQLQFSRQHNDDLRKVLLLHAG